MKSNFKKIRNLLFFMCVVCSCSHKDVEMNAILLENDYYKNVVNSIGALADTSCLIAEIDDNELTFSKLMRREYPSKAIVLNEGVCLACFEKRYMECMQIKDGFFVDFKVLCSMKNVKSVYNICKLYNPNIKIFYYSENPLRQLDLPNSFVTFDEKSRITGVYPIDRL